ncbi:MAG TPA: PDZ domain-containing protein [Longimicrobiales bacterium]|nr:PDZ domain-containing protein [Longimicrobiales bacterium]
MAFRGNRTLICVLAAGFLLVAFSAAGAQEETRLLRFPSIHGNTVAFTYAGDLYTVPLAGGEAKRLTSHEGFEVFARFSPDGRWIAFSGEYAGTRQVYVMPSEGGTPRQVTFYPDGGPMPPRGGYDNLPLDWTRDGKILVRSARTPWGERVGNYWLVDPVNGGLETRLEIPEGASGATFDATGTKLAYNIKSREWRHWKRYRAGRQQDVWTYDLANHTSERITDEAATDNLPMWIGDEIYFVSDRDAREKLNLWVYDTRDESTTQVTTFTEFDVLWPSRGEGGIVFENGGYLYHLDPATKRTSKIPVTVTGDRPYTNPNFKAVGGNIESFDISPSGKRAIFAARGEIFTVPAENGNIDNISNTPAERERGVTWSPDGKWITYFSDADGNYDLYLMPSDRSAAPERLATGDRVWMDGVQWSPDSRRLAWSDNMNRIQAMDLASRSLVTLDETGTGALNDFSWSGDGRWIAYSKNAANGMSSIWLYSFDSGSRTQVTSDMTRDFSPAFDPKGRYLYFVSARDFAFSGSGSSFRSRIYAASLKADFGQIFPPLSDEEAGVKDSTAAPKEAQDAAPFRIDLQGLGDRVMPLPGLDAGSYNALIGVDEGVLYFSGGTLSRYKLEDRKSEEIITRITGFALTPDRKKLLYRFERTDYGIVDLRPDAKNDAGRLDLAEMQLRIDPKVEWAQEFHDAYLIFRDWFYDPGMHGVDWEAMYHRYEPLVKYVAHRSDLDYLIGEMLGEVNVGHAYITQTPELPAVDRVPVGLLGAEYEADGRYYRIANIFPGENWHEEFRSPLTEPGVDVREGDYLIAIDGQDVTTADNPYSFLTGKADRVVEVMVNSRPSREGARSCEVKPVTSELGLRYQEWVRRNAALVDSLSGGRIGYIHLPNTSQPGFRELYEGFQPLHTKEALILDDRYNGGGFIPEEMAFMMGAPLLNYWAQRNLDMYTQPAVVHTGPKAMLINGQSSSGGDALPYYFREMGLGPLIGEKTWGGLVGYSGNPGFVDGGGVIAPRFGFINKDGQWDVEAFGVSPDEGYEVLDRPEEIAAGREPMIERAVRYLLEELAKPHPTEPPKPAGPIRRAPGGGN